LALFFAIDLSAPTASSGHDHCLSPDLLEGQLYVLGRQVVSVVLKFIGVKTNL
jgi:hypothetical protein